MKTIFIITSIVLIYYILKNILGITVIDILKYFRDGLSLRLAKSAVKVEHKMEKLDKIKQNNTLAGKYTRLLNEILIDLGWKKEGLNAGSTTMAMLVISVFGSLIICFALSSYILLPLLVFPVFLFLFFAMFAIGKQGHTKRVNDIMEFEDTIAPVIARGVEVAIREYKDAIPESIKPSVEKFLDRGSNQNRSFPEAMKELTDNLGEDFTDFANKAIIFEMEEREGLSEIFKDTVVKNGRVREINRLKNERFKVINTDFQMSLALCILFVIGSCILNPGARQIYAMPIGKILIVADILILVCVFSYGQYLQTDIKKGGSKK